VSGMKRIAPVVGGTIAGCFAVIAATCFLMMILPDQYMPPVNWPFDEGARKTYKPFSGSSYVIR
jgi:hypothetical protein